jgi:hypothetical protein
MDAVTVESTRAPQKRGWARNPLKAQLDGAVADCKFWAAFPYRRYWHRPIGALEAAAYLRDDGRGWMPGVGRQPQLYAIVRCHTVQRPSRRGQTIFIERHIELLDRDTWQKAVERRKAGDFGADALELASWVDVRELQRRDLRPNARPVVDIDVLLWAEMTGAL